MAGSSASGNKDTRTRNWSVVIYPDSAPDGWREYLDEQHIEWVESPLHDKDKNADGEAKKAHQHLMLMFGGVKSYEQVVEFVAPLHCPIPQRVHNAKAMVRYMAHMDNPEKYQYEKSEIKAHGGVDLEELLRPSSSERYDLIRDMVAYIKDNNITEFQDIMDAAAKEHFDDWFPLLCDNSAFVIGQYIKSQRHRNEHPKPVKPSGKASGSDRLADKKRMQDPFFKAYLQERDLNPNTYISTLSPEERDVVWNAYEEERRSENN